MKPILSVLILLAVACGGSSGPYDASVPGSPASSVPDAPVAPVDPDPAPADPVPSGPPNDTSSGALQTFGDRFILERGSIGWETAIPFTYRNSTAGPVFVMTCNGPHPPTLEKWVDGRWVAAWNAVRLMCLGPVLRIESGATYSGSLGLFAGFPSGNYYPKFQFDDPEGVYRLVWEPLSSYQPQSPFGPLLPLDDRVSNPFELIEGD